MKEEKLPPPPVTAVSVSNNEGAFLRRVFRNGSGDWDKVEAIAKELNKYALVWDGLAEDLVKVQTKIKDLTLEAYRLAPQVDSLYYDSPVSPSQQIFYAKQHLKKLGWEAIRDIHTDPNHIELFSKRIKEACRWLLKFKNDKN